MMPVMDFRWGRVAYLASVILPIFEHVYGIPHEGICPLPRKERPKCGARNRQALQREGVLPIDRWDGSDHLPPSRHRRRAVP
jgi:hypothetical protein